MREGAAPAIEPPSLGYRRPERRRGMILLKERAERARQPNAVPGRTGKRHGVRQRRPHIVVEALNAATKSAGRQHDPPTRRYAAETAVDHEHGTANSTRRDCQLLQGRVQPNRHAVAAQAVKQPGDERIAHQQPGATPIAQTIARVPPQQRRRRTQRRERRQRPRERFDIIAADHHAAERHEFTDRRSHQFEVGAEKPSVERQRRQRSTADRGAGAIGQIVGVAGVGREFHLAAPIKIIDDVRAGLEIGVTALVERGANHRVEISPGISDIIGKTGFATLPGAGHPDRAGRGRGGATDAVGLFAKQHVEALERADQGCRHAGRPGADDKHVDLELTLRRTWRRDRHFPSDPVTARPSG